VAEVDGEKVDVFEISAADFDVFSLGNDLPSNCTADQSSRLIRDILENKMKDRDTERLVLINAAAAMYVAGKATDMPTAYNIVAESLRSGAALDKLNRLAAKK
jgi:anthranilate phosphoribosyltransferase